jgi:transcriptional regulator with XRE-family HTH domain
MAKKRITETEEVPLFQKTLNEASDESVVFIDLAVSIQARIHEILIEKGWQQKDLAAKMMKTEAEISKLLSGVHNHTIRSLAKISAALGESIITVNKKHKELLNDVHVNEYSQAEKVTFSTEMQRSVISTTNVENTSRVIYMNKNPNAKTLAV